MSDNLVHGAMQLQQQHLEETFLAAMATTTTVNGTASTMVVTTLDPLLLPRLQPQVNMLYISIYIYRAFLIRGCISVALDK